MTEAKFQSLLEENEALKQRTEILSEANEAMKQRTDILSDIASLVTAANGAKSDCATSRVRTGKPDQLSAGQKVPCYSPANAAEEDSDSEATGASRRSEGASSKPSMSSKDAHPSSDIRKTSRGQFQISLLFHSSFMGNINGAKGKMRDRLERETQTAVRIPPKGEEGDVVITGYEIEDVLEVGAYLC